MFIKDLFFPKMCFGCGYLGVYICPSCSLKLVYLENDTCIYCKKPSLYGLTHPICRRNLGIDGFICIFYYNNILKRIIKSIKYRLTTEGLKDLFAVIKPQRLEKIAFYKKLGLDLRLCPIPLHKDRLRARGFNQAALIVDFIANFLNVSRRDLLIRKKATLPQARLKDKKTRYQNLKNAYEISKNINLEGKSIILVDDIVTSGATVAAAARTLKKSKVLKVYVFALAKG